MLSFFGFVSRPMSWEFENQPLKLQFTFEPFNNIQKVMNNWFKSLMTFYWKTCRYCQPINSWQLVNSMLTTFSILIYASNYMIFTTNILVTTFLVASVEFRHFVILAHHLSKEYIPNHIWFGECECYRENPHLILI